MAKITLFGLAGTGKSSTAKGVADILKYDFKSSGNMFREMASELGMTLNEFERLCIENPEYDKKLDARVGEYGSTHDNFIFESRLAWHFIPDSFKIILVCEETDRLQRVADREHKTFEQVKDETLERESLIYKRYQEYYGIENINDLTNYDFIVDTKKNTLQEVIKIILDELANRKLISAIQQ
jgi:cytidylate kinase